MRGVSERENDERDLRMIQMVIAGVDRREISARIGMTRPYIGAVLGRVCRSDMAESGEPADLVRIAYLPPAKPRPKKLRGAFAGRF